MIRPSARLGTLFTAMLLTASSAVPLARAAQPREQVTLSMWAWADRNLCAQAYMKANPNVKIIYTEQQGYVPKLNVLKRAGGSGIPDVLFANSEDVANLYQLGFTTDLSAAIPASGSSPAPWMCRCGLHHRSLGCHPCLGQGAVRTRYPGPADHQRQVGSLPTRYGRPGHLVQRRQPEGLRAFPP